MTTFSYIKTAQQSTHDLLVTIFVYTFIFWQYSHIQILLFSSMFIQSYYLLNLILFLYWLHFYLSNPYIEYVLEFSSWLFCCFHCCIVSVGSVIHYQDYLPLLCWTTLSIQTKLLSRTLICICTFNSLDLNVLDTLQPTFVRHFPKSLSFLDSFLYNWSHHKSSK